MLGAFPEIHTLNPNAQHVEQKVGVEGLWEVIGHEGRVLTNAVSITTKAALQSSLAPVTM